MSKRSLSIIRGVKIRVIVVFFNYISDISWQSVLLVEKPGHVEKTTDMPQVTDNLYHIVLY